MLNQGLLFESISSDLLLINEFSETLGYNYVLLHLSPVCIQYYQNDKFSAITPFCQTPPDFDKESFQQMLGRLISVDFNTSKTGRVKQPFKTDSGISFNCSMLRSNRIT